MGNSPSGILAYGYDLGGPEAGWKVTGAEKYGDYRFPWYSPEKDYSWGEKAEELLLAELTGLTAKYEDNKPDEFYDARAREARKKLKVEIVTYGSYDYPGYILAVKPHLYVYDWEAKAIPQFDFSYHESNQELDKALRVLGITPTQQDPQWILACMYG